MDRKEHWNQVYKTKGPEDISWHQEFPAVSLGLVENIKVPPGGGVVDVGGGSSVFAAELVKAGYHPVTVLDISAMALGRARERAGRLADAIEWVEADVSEFSPSRSYHLWHDRAVFHFLTDQADRARYVAAVERGLSADGHLILATFAPDGPEKCSGLPVRRYDAALISVEFGAGFELIEELAEIHMTPWQSEQKFRYFHFRRRPGVS